MSAEEKWQAFGASMGDAIEYIFIYFLIPQNSKRISDSEESTNPAVRVTERKS